MANHTLKKTIIYLISVAIIAGFIVGASWGVWVMFFSWNLSATKDWARIVIVATSVFWLCVGGLLWLIPSRRPKN